LSRVDPDGGSLFEPRRKKHSNRSASHEFTPATKRPDDSCDLKTKGISELGIESPLIFERIRNPLEGSFVFVLCSCYDAYHAVHLGHWAANSTIPDVWTEPGALLFQMSGLGPGHGIFPDVRNRSGPGFFQTSGLAGSPGFSGCLDS
jgi:hypothetical protein